MSRTAKAVILARAVRRLSPRMAAYMARRVARNRLAVRFPDRYRARISAIEETLPRLGRPPADLPTGLVSMAEFYCAEYRDVMDGVLQGRVCLHGHEIDFGASDRVDWNRGVPEEGDHQMWRVKLAHMGFLCPMMLEGGPEHYAVVATLVAGARSGTDMTAPGAFNAYWFPYAASHRILSLGAGLMLARARGTLPPETDAAVADLLRYNVAFVLDNVEHELNNNHVERNLAALCLYFTYAESIPPAIAARLERDVAHLVGSTILEDGCQIERSPMYQGLSVASLAVLAETPFLSAALRARLSGRLDAARRAFAILCHPDGQVALFNDAWHDEVPHWTGPPAPEGRSLLPQGGYGRLSQGEDLCLMDAGPLGPSWNPGHGHADFLSLEITLGAERLIVDPGTSRYNTGADRARERSAAAHNGPCYEGIEPVEFTGCFKVGRMAEARLLDEGNLPLDTIGGTFRGTVGGAARMVRHYPGQGFLVADYWDSETPGAVSWLVPGSWQASTGPEDSILLHKNGSDARIVPLAGRFRAPAPQASSWACHYGRREAAHEIRLRGEAHTGGGQALLCWIGRTTPPDSACEDGAVLLDRLAALSESSR
ncbi:Heparinase II/III-like protein [Salipiger thiooxidans]|uniref:Heparinase II/III-like protein n=1 Tax=Salipiger thiooxidans TaxID=282683 RepID=A0A1G7N8Z3_9RHOB|nr:heparinase II/III family protein [Salipiger thiooxidans]SDF69819.1 Heparinase II/III-like protein [Salipiger thiooxidans]